MSLSADATTAWNIMQQSPFNLLAQVETSDRGLVAQVVNDPYSSYANGLFIASYTIIDELALAGHIRPHITLSEHYIYANGQWIPNPSADAFVDPLGNEIPPTEINRGTLYELTGV